MNFDNINLISHHISRISSRNDIDINVDFGGLNLINPIIASPMKDVVNTKIARIMNTSGGFAIIHRFQSIEDQIEQYKGCKTNACAIGLKDLDRFHSLYNEDCRIFCIDVANGASKNVLDFINMLNRHKSDCQYIVGNICSVKGFAFLSGIKNVLAIRCGIAGGNVCTTKYATGIYSNMLSLLESCRFYKKFNKLSVKIIADGGIRNPADYCKSMIFGADAIMLGSLIASTPDSPAEVVEINGAKFKIIRGSASFDIQKIYKDEPKYIEGETKIIPINNLGLYDLLEYFNNGLRSSMSYFNAMTLEEYRNNIGYEKV